MHPLTSENLRSEASVVGAYDAFARESRELEKILDCVRQSLRGAAWESQMSQMSQMSQGGSQKGCWSPWESSESSESSWESSGALWELFGALDREKGRLRGVLESLGPVGFHPFAPHLQGGELGEGTSR